MMLQKIATFSINYQSPEDGQSYSGSFTVKKLSVMDVSRIRQRVAQLNGGMHHDLDDDGNATGKGVDWSTEQMNAMIAHLDVAVKTAPPWWNLEEVSDFGLLKAVYDEVQKFEETFRNRGRPNAGSAVGGAGGANATGLGGVGAEGSGAVASAPVSSGRVAEVVGAQVPVALD